MTGPVSLEVAGHQVTITHPDKVVFDSPTATRALTPSSTWSATTCPSPTGRCAVWPVAR